MHVCVKSLQSCPILGDPMDCSPPGSSVHGNLLLHFLILGFPGGSEGRVSACNVGDLDSIPRSGRSPGEGNGNPLQYPCLENPLDRGAW